MSKVLITGAGGYVGGRLVSALAGSGHEVHGVVREETPWLGIEQTVCDLATIDPDALHSACDGVHAIVHLAGDNEVRARREPAAALSDTVVATEKLVEAATGTGVRRLVYMSTVHVYGEQMAEGASLTEDLRPEPRSNYAISRLASEHLAAMLRADGTDLVVFRLTNSVGAPADPHVDRWTLVANDLCRQGVQNGRLELLSSGQQWRDFVALRDVCDIVSAATQPRVGLPPGTYNLGSGQSATVHGLAELVQDAFEQETGIRPELHAPEHVGVVPKPYHVSVAKMENHGLRASTTLAEAVGETVRFCLENREELR